MENKKRDLCLTGQMQGKQMLFFPIHLTFNFITNSLTKTTPNKTKQNQNLVSTSGSINKVQSMGNRESGLPLGDHDSSYIKFDILVNGIILRSLSSDHMWIATFDTTFTLPWKCLTNYLGINEVISPHKEESKETQDLILVSHICIN